MEFPLYSISARSLEQSFRDCFPLYRKLFSSAVGIFHRNLLGERRNLSRLCFKRKRFCLCQKYRLRFSIYRKQSFQERDRNLQTVFQVRIERNFFLIFEVPVYTGITGSSKGKEIFCLCEIHMRGIFGVSGSNKIAAIFQTVNRRLRQLLRTIIRKPDSVVSIEAIPVSAVITVLQMETV